MSRTGDIGARSSCSPRRRCIPNSATEAKTTATPTQLASDGPGSSKTSVRGPVVFVCESRTDPDYRSRRACRRPVFSSDSSVSSLSRHWTGAAAWSSSEGSPVCCSALVERVACVLDSRAIFSKITKTYHRMRVSTGRTLLCRTTESPHHKPVDGDIDGYTCEI